MPHATQYFIRNTILILGKALICSQNSLVALIPHDVGNAPLKTGSLLTCLRHITLHICQLYSHVTNLPFCHIPKVFLWIQIC